MSNNWRGFISGQQAGVRSLVDTVVIKNSLLKRSRNKRVCTRREKEKAKAKEEVFVLKSSQIVAWCRHDNLI